MKPSRLGLVVANGLTLGNAACGFAGVLVLALEGRPAIPLAVALVFGAWLFDTVDGMAARAFGVSGPFGAALDSLCDVVSFGVLPALIVCVAAQGTLRPFALAAAGLCLAGALLRLARYTVKAVGEAPGAGPAASDGRLWFEGLPSTAGAMIVAALALAAPAWAAAAGAAAAGLLMPSRRPYPDLTRFYLQRRLPAWTLLLPLPALLAAPWPAVLAGVLVLYGALAPLLRLRRA